MSAPPDTFRTVGPPQFVAGRASAVMTWLSGFQRAAWIGRPSTYALGALVLTLLGCGTTLMAPRLLGPVEFGRFALLTTLFTYAGRVDLGLSQLADKQIVGKAGPAATEAARDILGALWLVGLLAMAVTVPVALLLAGAEVAFSPLDTVLAVGGGVMAMIANGPVTVYRAASRLWEFTALALILQLGMTAPRLAGLLYGGVTGTFAVLAVYYAILALLFARPVSSLPSLRSLAAMARLSLPLFAFTAIWVFYLGANRWIASALSSPHDLGLFSFGASLAMIGLGLLSTIAQVRYPKLLVQMGQTGEGRSGTIGASTAGIGTPGAGAMVERELLALTGLLAAIALAAILFAGPVIGFAFPAFTEATPSTIAFAAACVPLGVMTWMVPMIVVRSHRPMADAAMLAAVGFLSLVLAMIAGDRLAGIEGQAWGNAAAAFGLLVAMALIMFRLGMLGWRVLCRIIGVQATVLGVLALIVAVASPAPARAQTAAVPISTDGWKVIFEDDFDRLDLQLGDVGIWLPYYPGGGRSNSGNNELQYYVDPRPAGDSADIQALEPYRVVDGVLEIRANKVPDALRAQSGGYAYASGLLTPYHRLNFLYGAVEIRAKVPRGRGLWPAFWLLPTDRTWPPELDVLEVLGHDTHTLHVTAHSGIAIPAGDKSARTGAAVPTADLSEDFHVYGLIWTADRLVWTLDGQAVFETPTPQDLHKPMFPLVNLAVGGNWPGSPDAMTAFPATFHVDWIRVRQPTSEIPQAELENKP